MDNHDKLSNSCVENPKLGHRYLKFLSNGLKASRSGLSSANKSTTQYSIVLDLKLSPICKKGYKRKAGFFLIGELGKLNYCSQDKPIVETSELQYGSVKSRKTQCSAVPSSRIKCHSEMPIFKFKYKCSPVQSPVVMEVNDSQSRLSSSNKSSLKQVIKNIARKS